MLKSLKPYKSLLKGKFVIGSAEPFIFGGMFIYLTFLDAPDKIFSTSIYSIVDVSSGTVFEYSITRFNLTEEESGITKEEILKMIKEHPENKLW